MKNMFGYTRVSTAKQGEGVSLEEQKRAIEIYAGRNDLEISRWFEEKETAAKSGRPVFSEMLRLLRKGEAQGVIIHKIDRSARNLRDWADIGELIDSGIEIHFAHEALDLAARSGRLSADIQAVIAADFIRNLREETKKGMYGRLRQGLYPLRAPIGYLDTGPGRPKEIDPEMGPLVKKLFELYATRRYGLRELSDRMFRIGLRNRQGGRVSRNGISTILHNTFYIGLMKIKASNQVFQGKHEPLVKKSLFDKVQDIAASKTASSRVRHDHLFRRKIKCGICGGILTGELQKGRVYYRCHRYGCKLSGLREDFIEDELSRKFSQFLLTHEEMAQMKEELHQQIESTAEKKRAKAAALELRLKQTEIRLGRLSDMFIDDLVDQGTYNRENERLLHEIAGIKERIMRLDDNQGGESEDPVKNFELLISLVSAYFSGNRDDKRELIDFATSNYWTLQESLEIPMRSPFCEVENRLSVSLGVLRRANIRTRLAGSNKKLSRSKNPVPVVFSGPRRD